MKPQPEAAAPRPCPPCPRRGGPGRAWSVLSLLLVLLLSLAPGWARAQAPAPAFLVDAAWLESRLADPKLVLLEVRYHPHRHLSVGHLPGAIQVQRFKDLGDNGAPVIMRFPARDDFQASLRRWGVDDDSTVVIYDDSRSALASRLYFLLALYGYDMSRVRILDGGTLDWTAFNELSKLPTRAARPGMVSLKPADRGLYVEWPEVYERVVARREPGLRLIDARPRDMYSGKVVRHAIQGGHIPGAINIVSLDGTDAQSQKWLTIDRLAALYGDLPRDATLIAYCHDGFRSTLAWLQLKALGFRDVRVMNGGWSQWDRALTLPVVEGDAPFDEEFGL